MPKSRKAIETRRPASAAHVFPPRRDYVSLSLKDLLDAREAYHVFLSSLENVVATAVGRYFIRESDWYADNPPDEPRPADRPRDQGPRTLENSVIRPWSWPAVLVFVRRWEQRDSMGTEAVPRALYLPDGRIVPTCVILATPDESLPPPAAGPFHVSGLLGGGYLCVREHQGERSLGTIACLVRKGGSYYALTNRHVAGGDGEAVRAYVRGQYIPVATTSSIAVDRVGLSNVFPSWSGNRVLLTLDAGLARIADINNWTSQAFGIGEIGDVFDATEHSVTLDLIGTPVRAFGGVSGVSEGEIRALFFRFESLGGYDYVTDVLIGPRRRGKTMLPDRPLTRPGDSGTLWFYDPPSQLGDSNADIEIDDAVRVAESGVRARRLRPIAMQWGGQRVILPGQEPSSYALATFLSSICRLLDIEVVRDWSLGHDEYWGKIGHFSIGWKACEQVKGRLAQLMKLNQPRIGFDNDTLGQGAAFRMGRGEFVPLADVPDYVWVHARKNEPIQHFADVDIVDIHGGPPLLDRCHADKSNVAASVWKEYFDGFAAKGVGPEEGAIPFRVWQIWDAMVTFLKKKDAMRFVAAAGVLAHYVGDASQPLHCSYLHHGVLPSKTVDGRPYPVPYHSEEAEVYKKTPEAKIHGIYEETMLEVDPLAALQGVDKAIGESLDIEVSTGYDAAVATMDLMYNCHQRLPPQQILDADDPELTQKARAEQLWDNEEIKEATIASLADSVELLAALWTAAWEKGNGDEIPEKKLKAFDEDDLEKVYRDHKFLPSLSLDQMVESRRFEPAVSALAH